MLETEYIPLPEEVEAELLRREKNKIPWIVLGLLCTTAALLFLFLYGNKNLLFLKLLLFLFFLYLDSN